EELPDEEPANPKNQGIPQHLAQDPPAVGYEHDDPYENLARGEWFGHDHAVASAATEGGRCEHEVPAPVGDGHLHFIPSEASRDPILKGPACHREPGRRPPGKCVRAVDDGIAHEPAVVGCAKVLQVEGVCPNQVPGTIEDRPERARRPEL